MKKIIFLLPLLMIQSLFAQGIAPNDWGLKAFHFKDSKLGDINYYVTENGIDQKKPLLFLISGCRGLPTMLVVETEGKSIQLGTVPPDQISYFSDDYHVAFMGKAGTPFCDTLKADAINPLKNLEDYQPSAEYIRKCGMEWEVQASSLVIDSLYNMLPLASNKVVAMGFSEGGHLVVNLANENKKITHMVSVVSGVLNQFYSSIINRRMDAAAGNITHAAAQAQIDSLFAVYKEIYSDPNSTEKWYYGHPYKRWGSYCNNIPLEKLVQLEIPILYLNGTADRNNPVLQSDYAMLEFLRLGKTNMTYHVIPGCDHWFYETVMENGKRKHVSHKEEAFKVMGNWMAAN